MNWLQRVAKWLGDVSGLASVTAVPVGREDDGLVPFRPAGTQYDKQWWELAEEIDTAREAWRRNPLAKRIIGMTTAYVIGPGITLSSNRPQLAKFINEFWSHEKNMIGMRLDDWCDELGRAGELFPVLFTNPVDGMSYVRTVPAALIDQVEWLRGDYESELRYREITAVGEDEKWWISPYHPDAHEPLADGTLRPWMLHFAINRVVGAVRGESDLAPILTWLRRYNGWLEDRVRMNAAMRAFLWIVYGPQRLLAGLRERYRTPPEPGTIIIAEEGAEKWEAVAPNLNARDAKEDGKAIRWMVAAGGPGTTLGDLGEGEGTGLRAGHDASELRRRFLLRRQRYFCHMLAVLTVTAYNRWLFVGRRRYARAQVTDVIVHAPDISAEDNELLAGAVRDLMASFVDLERFVGRSDAFKALALRMFARYSGEQIGETEFGALVAGQQQSTESTE
jgi:hypothetical protein